MKRNRLLILGLLLGSAAIPAAAQDRTPSSDVHWRDGICPACDRKVGLAVVSFSGPNAGLDRDLFTRSTGPQPEFYLVNTCTHCGFSGYLADFDLVLPEKLKDQIRKTLRPPAGVTPKTPPQEVATLEKYGLAYQTFKILGRSDEAFAWLALRASWVARDLYCALPKHPEIVRVLLEAGKCVPPADNATNPADRELAQAGRLAAQLKSSSIPVQMQWSYDAVIALLYRRHGENQLAVAHIGPVLGSKQAPAALRENSLKMKESIATERYWQNLAADHFRQALLAGTIAAANRPVARYLLGELYRRLDRPQDAKTWLDQALRDPRLPPNLKQWAKEARGRMP